MRIPRFVVMCAGGLAAVASWATCGVAHADIVFGLNASQTGGGIYQIDTSTGAMTLYRATPSLVGISVDANGLAYDAPNDTFYYINRVAGVNSFIRNAPSGEVNLGTMASTANLDSGTFYNGFYWTQPSSSNQLIRVTPTIAGFTALPFTIPGAAFGNFGDIASDPNGVTFASQSGTMRRYDLDNPGAGFVPLATNANTMQIAFGAAGGLYGVNNDTIYSINTVSGSANSIATLQFTNMNIIDLATAPSPGAGAASMMLIGLAASRRRR